MSGTVCMVCAARGVFRWAYVTGYCVEHMDQAGPDARVIKHETIEAMEEDE